MYIFKTKGEMLRWAFDNVNGSFSYLIEESDYVIGQTQLVYNW